MRQIPEQKLTANKANAAEIAVCMQLTRLSANGANGTVSLEKHCYQYTRRDELV